MMLTYAANPAKIQLVHQLNIQYGESLTKSADGNQLGDDGMASKALTDRNFDAELVAPGRMVLVIFYDENYSNRYLIEPGLAKLDEQYGQRVKFCRINTRENPKVAERFRIFISPTILFFQDGKLVESLAGTFPRVEVENMIRKLLTEKEEDRWSLSRN